MYAALYAPAFWAAPIGDTGIRRIPPLGRCGIYLSGDLKDQPTVMRYRDYAAR
jgi:hypothetical protein